MVVSFVLEFYQYAGALVVGVLAAAGHNRAQDSSPHSSTSAICSAGDEAA
jgi:hypothetical protein